MRERLGIPKIRLIKRVVSSRWLNLSLPVIAIASALAFSAIFLLILGFNVSEIYSVLWQGAFGSYSAISSTVSLAIPLMLCGLGVAFAFKMLLWNIGAEGQLYMGAWMASGVVLFGEGIPPVLILPCMILAGFMGGAIWGLLPALPKAYLGVNEVIVSLMLNYVAILWVGYFVHGPWRDPAAFGFPISIPFPSYARLPSLPGTRVHAGLLMAFVAATIFYLVFKYSSWGYQIEVTGASRKAALYGGMKIQRNIILVMMVSGGLAGLAGMSIVSGVIGNLQYGISTDYGYTAIIIAYLSKLNPIAILIVSILFGGLLTGGYALQVLGLSPQIVGMMQGVILFFILGIEFFRKYQVRIIQEGEE